MHRALAALVLVYATFSWVVVQVYWRIKKSSKTKAKLYKAWLANKTTETKIKYKNYKKIGKSLALECDAITGKCLTKRTILSGRFGRI